MSASAIDARVEDVYNYAVYYLCKTAALRSVIGQSLFFIVLSVIVTLIASDAQGVALSSEERALLQLDRLETFTSAEGVAAWFPTAVDVLRSMRAPPHRFRAALPLCAVLFETLDETVVYQSCADAQTYFLHPAEARAFRAACANRLASRRNKSSSFLVSLSQLDGLSTNETLALVSNFTDSVVVDNSVTTRVVLAFTSTLSPVAHVVTVTYQPLSYLVTAEQQMAIPLAEVSGSTHAVLTALLLVVLAAYVVFLFLDEVMWMRTVHRATRTYSAYFISFQFVVSVASIGLLITCLVLGLVGFGTTVPVNAGGRNGLRYLQSMASYQTSFRSCAAWLYIGSFYRLLVFSQYWRRLNLVAIAVQSALPALLGCFIVFLLLVTSFAIVALHFFSGFILEFRTIASTLPALMLLLFRGGSMDWGRFFAQSPIATIAFFLMYLLLTQLVVFNVIIGVVAHALSTTLTNSDLTQHVSWQPSAVWTDTVNFIRRYTSFAAANSSAGAALAATAPSSQGNGTAAAAMAAGAAPAPWLFDASLSAVSNKYARDVVVVLEAIRPLQRTRIITVDDLRSAVKEFQTQMGQPTTEDASHTEPEWRHLAAESVSLENLCVIITKASRHIGNLDAVGLQILLSKDDSRRSQRLNHDFWRCARITQELHSQFCRTSSRETAAARLSTLMGAAPTASQATAEEKMKAARVSADGDKIRTAIGNAVFKVVAMRDRAEAYDQLLQRLLQRLVALTTACMNIRRAVEHTSTAERQRGGVSAPFLSHHTSGGASRQLSSPSSGGGGASAAAAIASSNRARSGTTMAKA